MQSSAAFKSYWCLFYTCSIRIYTESLRHRHSHVNVYSIEMMMMMMQMMMIRCNRYRQWIEFKRSATKILHFYNWRQDYMYVNLSYVCMFIYNEYLWDDGVIYIFIYRDLCEISRISLMCGIYLKQPIALTSQCERFVNLFYV